MKAKSALIIACLALALIVTVWTTRAEAECCSNCCWNDALASVQAGSPDGKAATGNMYATSGAQAIIHPLPQIPNELRDQDFTTFILARFCVAADGSVQVALAQPTPSLRLNRVLMDSLEKWRFRPAIRNGQPVASTEEILVKIGVKEPPVKCVCCVC